ncbi:MAG: beta-lactamase family protein [Planctomycetales bacterium]|nr:beta-lactamase family protein [Planctomycetales bacterium]
MLRIFSITTILLAITVQTQLLLAADDEFAPFDHWMTSFLQDHKVPGGSLAMVRDGKVVYARGFGLADKDKKTPVQPESLFRIASISKPITAVAILKLVEEGKLKTSDKILDILKYEPHFEGDAKFDERWKEVTIAQCLAHTGGWDRGVSYDPMFQAHRMAKSMKIDLPILPEHIIRYQLGQKLDFTPGERRRSPGPEPARTRFRSATASGGRRRSIPTAAGLRRAPIWPNSPRRLISSAKGKTRRLAADC